MLLPTRSLAKQLLNSHRNHSPVELWNSKDDAVPVQAFYSSFAKSFYSSFGLPEITLIAEI